MQTEKYIPIKKAALKNNCPECFSKDGLKLTFKQKFIENSFYKFVTKDIKPEINCDTCNTIIYPERWTDDMERTFNYHQKAFTPRATLFHIKKISWVIISLTLVIIIGVLVIANLNLD